MVLDCAAGDCSAAAVCVHWRRSRDAPVELAAAAPVRVADAGILASAGLAGAVPDSVRRSGAWRARTSRWARISRAVDRKSTRLNSSHQIISYAVFCLKKKITKELHWC